jgi:type II secretory pathway pseudopilin PulG
MNSIASAERALLPDAFGEVVPPPKWRMTMISIAPNLFAILLWFAMIPAGSSQSVHEQANPQPPRAPLFRELHYDGTVTDDEARFLVDVTIESTAKQECTQTMFEGDVALLPPKLPAPLQIERTGNQYRLRVSRPGTYRFRLELVARITRVEPWNQIALKGPETPIAAMTARAAGDVDLQLVSGTLVESSQTNGAVRVRGFLGADRLLALRWSRAGGPAEVARKSVITVDTAASAQITPTVIKYMTQLRYEIIQGKAGKLRLALPAAQALTRLAGDQIRDWEIKTEPGSNGVQILSVAFIKPLEKEYQLTVFSEQPVEGASASLTPPQPLDLEREAGSLTLATEDTQAEIDSALGLRQVNAPSGALAAYQFNGRPFSVALKLKRIEPVISAAGRVRARVEETRLLAWHALTLTVEKAGIYSLDLAPQAGFGVADVRGEGIEDWKLNDNGTNRVLRVNFASRVLGVRPLDVQLEQALKNFPDQISIEPLRVSGATRETTLIGAASAPGIRLKTVELNGLREVPVAKLGGRTDELLAFTSEEADWNLALAAEHLAPRVVAEIFNLVTIGDGIVGGSATIRYGLVNQGVQEFELTIPMAWKNVEFTGPNIRRKEQREPGVWTIGLQDKVWGGYTLVVTYDYQFDPKGATLPLGGIHARGAERESGSIAITTAASLKLETKTASATLHRVDEGELAPVDRALSTRAVLLAYQYSEPAYELMVDAKHFAELPVLSAVADRTQLTTVLNDAGELLTQASFMVKNNDKQFQKFKLPQGANFWSCYVNSQAVKAERDAQWLMVPLPRGPNRDQAFAVDIVYTEKKGLATALFPAGFRLEAPQTDVPNTYAEWQFYAPAWFRLSGFGGNMTVARGTTYGLQDAWDHFISFYRVFFIEAGPGLFGFGVIAVLTVALVASAIRKGLSGVFTVLGIFCIISVLAAMLLPALARSKARAQRINAVNSLKQIGLAVRTFALDNGDRFPASFDEMMNELSTDKITIDPESGQPFVYVGAGLSEGDILPESVIAFSPTDIGGHRNVLLADGSVQQMSSGKFAELTRRGYILPATPAQIAQNRQNTAVRDAQLPARGAAAANPAPQAVNVTNLMAGVAAAPKPGIRSIRIDLPRSGQLFIFTKVLNAGGEALTLQAKIMKWRTFLTTRIVLQLGAFCSGLLLCWWQWKRARSSSFVLTVGLALVLGSVADLLIAWRSLHTVLIVCAPILALTLLAWVVWKYWPRNAPALTPESPPLASGAADAGPALASIALLLFIHQVSAGDLERSPAPGLSNSAVSVLSATYSGAIDDRVAQLDATLQISAGEPGRKLLLFADDVAVKSFSAKPSEVRIAREGNSVAVLLPGRGMATLQLKLLVKLSGDVTRRQLVFGIPAALSSSCSLLIDEPEADVDFPTAVSFKRSIGRQQTRVEAVIGPAERVEMRWTPRVKRAAEIAANVTCHNAALVTFARGMLNARAILDYQVTQGEMRQARVKLPSSHRLLRVEGESIRTWETKTENGESILVVDLLRGVTPSYRLIVESQAPLAPLPSSVAVETPHAVDVKRETGLVAVSGEEELDLAVDRAHELYRVDALEFTRVAALKNEAALNAFRFLKPDFGLQVRVAATEPKIEATARNRIRISGDQINLSAAIDYIIKRAGVFSLKVALPDGYRLDEVTGTNILQWAERAQGAQRIVEVTLRERITGNYALGLDLIQNLKTLPNRIEIAGVHPLAVQKLTGFLSVSAESGIAINPASFEGLTEIPASSVAGHDATAAGSVLAYKFLASEAQPAPTWKLSVGTEVVESWVRAEIVNTLTLTDSLINGQALARFEIQNAPIKELRLRIPAPFQHVEISGPGIRRRDHDGEVWKVEFQNRIRGGHTLTVTWDQPRPAQTNQLELTGVSAEGVERETGILAVVARPPLQVTPHQIADLKTIDTGDLPEWAGRPDESIVLAYRYLRPGYKLALEAKRFDEAETLRALVENVNLATVVADDGQMMTRLFLSVRNNGRQHLEIGLPPGASVWSSFVAGQAVRPSVREGKLLLPLEQSAGEDAPIAIELTYTSTTQFPRRRGTVDLVSPQLDVPFKNASWELFLPPDYTYRDFSGTMFRETAISMPEASSFSFFDYSKRESENKATLTRELKSDLYNAKTKLSSGNVKEAWADYSRARSKGNFDAVKDADTKQLEEDLRKAQGSNLIQAQSAFTLNNGSPGAAQQPSLLAGQYDAAAAEAQWTRLQQAQEVAIARVQPIRVNLPTRGLRHVFSQVLQTEISKPMTIRLMAVNSKRVNWAKRLTVAAGGFGLLWLLVARVTARGSRKASIISAT